MMIRHAITYLMIALLAVQSVVASADAHQLHQSGTEHLTFDHEQEPTHNPETDQEIKSSATLGSISFDCHHCCHCHGHGAMIFAESELHLVALFLGNGPVSYNAIYTLGIPPSLYRPPIA
ncbi:hypothetical protein [Simiduia agarivorans]|uniref:DUF2946 domain-containing protein n=1 Tax=Simiduia agarivorans (strain DSM 21679 / JCM 13881 / BCRC 17597 / SA1) TaxID=1117647 RepID=K4KFS7_SIMAS|nr:hypothetical protein [Simiduia agarivorans]AFU97796.1 hypothetical protein M5M_02905 [Simiduia agarivorans SA1 = DSM 21679]